MGYYSVLIGIAWAHFLALMSPGPNFLVITQTAISRSRLAGICTALGVATATVVWTAFTILGLGLLLSEFGWLYGVLKLCGGAYLVYLGVRTWHGARIPLPPATTADARELGLWRSFRLGLFSNLSNPKSVVFFGSIFAALSAPDMPIWAKAAGVGIVVFNAVWFHCVLALVFSAGPAQASYRRLKRRVDQVTGVMMALFGLRLIWAGR